MFRIIMIFFGFIPYNLQFKDYSYCEFNRFCRLNGFDASGSFYSYERYFYRSGNSWKQGWWLAPWKIALPLFFPVFLYEAHRSFTMIYNFLAAIFLVSIVFGLLWLLHYIDKKHEIACGCPTA
jgi:hypothetical protein